MQLAYAGSAPSGKLTIDTNSGDRENLFLEAPTLPNDVSFCVATDGTCTGYAKGVPVVNMSMRFAASAEMRDLVVMDCVENRFDTPECERGGTGLDDELGAGDDNDNTGRDDFQYLTAFIDRVRFLELESSVPPVKGGQVGHLFANTTGRRGDDPAGTHPVDGVIKVRARTFDPDCGPPFGKLARTRAELDNVTANQRFATIQIQNSALLPPFTGCTATGVSIPNRNEENRGTMNCAIPGTSIDLAPNIQVLGAGQLRQELCRDDLDPSN